MNNTRRKIIWQVIEALKSGEPDWEWITDELNDVLSEEEEVRDNMEEHFSETERFQIVDDNCTSLQDAIDAIEPEDPDCIEEIINSLREVDGIW